MSVPTGELSHAFIRRIASEYLDDYLATIESIARKYARSPEIISNILHLAVQTPSITTLNTATAIANKVKNSTKNVARTCWRWETALLLRNRPSIEAELSYNQEKLKELKHQYDSYNDYCTLESNAPSKADIRYSIQETQATIRQLEKILAA